MVKKLHIKTYGCQMNVYDSERMAEAMGAQGYQLTDDPAEADLVLLNTCHIREKAAEKVYSDLGRLKPFKAENPDLLIGVAGCVAQAEGDEILRRMPLVDLVVGSQAYHRLPDMVRAAKAGARPVDTDFPAEDKFDHLPERPAQARPTAFLTVQEGCDKFCAFCVVPYTRGAEVSRPAARILTEAQKLVAKGVREITLLGQNVNAYADPDGVRLAALVRDLAAIEGLDRIRYTTSHPNDMGDDLIAAHAEVPQLMPYLHLPVQSGSDKVLKAMNRRHTAEDYLRLIDRIRAARPDIMLSGDFIAGFPGETDQDHRDTLALIEAVGYGMAYSFKYSARPGTPAADRALIDADVVDARLQEIQALITRQQRQAQADMVGRIVNVLFEKPGRLAGQMIGKSDYLHAVHVVTDARPGDLRAVRITASAPNSLAGELV
ncbi:tRNA (N6-isopentenyl adenosine(37)-C2)-methylthiotransferase MiaB [Paracoccus sp. p3-h83]|uniref:tRNA (N6-isopentenyl adenosine(37)-C2)-methylthiotransferase MiaB n=1 Tax=Paracoccus sp. p3-h83 TaxID=3342805 RepID=UPI0035B6F004